jgi:hypothetical protein
VLGEPFATLEAAVRGERLVKHACKRKLKISMVTVKHDACGAVSGQVSGTNFGISWLIGYEALQHGHHQHFVWILLSEKRFGGRNCACRWRGVKTAMAHTSVASSPFTLDHCIRLLHGLSTLEGRSIGCTSD